MTIPSSAPEAADSGDAEPVQPAPENEEVSRPTARRDPENPIEEDLLVEDVSIDGMCGVY